MVGAGVGSTLVEVGLVSTPVEVEAAGACLGARLGCGNARVRAWLTV